MLKYIVVLAFLALVYAEPSAESAKLKPKPRKAVVTLSGGAATGTIYFEETDDGIHITGTVSNIAAGKHGFHVHAVGDLSNGCNSTLGHFNPKNASHGAPSADERHVGDLGNIEANSSGIAVIDFVDSIITLDGENNIIGRGVVVHADADDLGLGDETDSKTTGHAGARIGCGVIGTLTDSGAEKLLTSIVPSIMLGLVILQRLL